MKTLHYTVTHYNTRTSLDTMLCEEILFEREDPMKQTKRFKQAHLDIRGRPEFVPRRNRLVDPEFTLKRSMDYIGK